MSMLPISAFVLELISAESRAPELFLQPSVTVPSWHQGLPFSQLLLLSPLGRTRLWSIAFLEGLTTALWTDSSCSSDYHSVTLLLSNLSVSLLMAVLGLHCCGGRNPMSQELQSLKKEKWLEGWEGLAYGQWEVVCPEAMGLRRIMFIWIWGLYFI